MSMKLDKMGWYVAVAMAGAMFGMGFKAPGDKVGNVDIGKIFQDSDFYKKTQEDIKNAKTARQGIIDLLRNYPTMKPDDAQRYSALTLSKTPGPGDKAQEDQIVQAAKDSDAVYRTLITKANPSASELAQISTYNQNKEINQQAEQKWGAQFTDELASMADTMQNDAIKKIRDAISSIGREQGFSVVFSTSAAPYSANDITDATTKLMNKSK